VAIRSNTRYLVINEPFHPAGSLMSRRLQGDLIALAERHNLHLLSDEAYRLLEHDPLTRLPAMADAYLRGISLCTLSKPWGACGVTIGWLALQDNALRQACIDVQYFGSACPGRDSDAILGKNLAIIAHNLHLLDKFFQRYSKFFQWVRPTAGAVGYVKFSGPMSSAALGKVFADAGISIKPAYVFSDPVHADAYRDYFRIDFGKASMPKALVALQRFVDGRQHSW
jgi:aspartate/methionine/tyrosine aminotransferase